MFSRKSTMWCLRCERQVGVRGFGWWKATCSRCDSADLKSLQTATRWCRPCERYVAAVRPRTWLAGGGWQCGACHSKDVSVSRWLAAVKFATFARSRDASVAGYVYVLTNPSMPGVVKVGSTAADPRFRADQLHTTGVPTPFAVAFSRRCVSFKRAERAAHAKLSRHRVSADREFFSVTVAQAVQAIESVC